MLKLFRKLIFQTKSDKLKIRCYWINKLFLTKMRNFHPDLRDCKTNRIGVRFNFRLYCSSIGEQSGYLSKCRKETKGKLAKLGPLGNKIQFIYSLNLIIFKKTWIDFQKLYNYEICIKMSKKERKNKIIAEPMLIFSKYIFF